MTPTLRKDRFVMYIRVNFYVLIDGEHVVFVSGNIHGEAVWLGHLIWRFTYK
jgi:hypothetical protein